MAHFLHRLDRCAAALAFVTMFACAPLSFAACEPGQYVGTGAPDGSDERFNFLVRIECANGGVTGRIQSPFGEAAITGGDSSATAWRVEASFDGQPLTMTAELRDGSWKGSYNLAGQTGTLTLVRDDSATFAAFPNEAPEIIELDDAQWQSDVDALASFVTTTHASPFHKISEAAWTAAVGDLRRRIPDLADNEVPVALRQLMSLIGDGHTSLRLPQEQPRLPVAFFWFSNELRIVRVAAGYEHLLGARVLNIGGTSAVVARRRASTLLAAENEWAVLSATPYLLRRQDVLRYLDLTQGDRVRVRVQRADGARETVTLPFVSDQAAPANIYVGGAAPIWAQQPNDGFWWRMLAPGVLYVNFRSYEKLRTRTADVMGLIDRDRPDKVILDMRDNSGGDFTVFRESMLKQIIARPWLNQDDRLFVLIGREMFSAAMTNAADLKIRTNATLVGEPIGERPNSYQEVRFFALPNSHLRAGVSTKYYEALPGQGNPDAVRPDVSRPPTWRRFSRNQDDALEWVLHQD